MGRKVWVVSHDESPHNTVLGIFETQDEASTFADEIQDRFENGVIYFSWIVGTRYDEGIHYSSYSGPAG